MFYMEHWGRATERAFRLHHSTYLTANVHVGGRSRTSSDLHPQITPTYFLYVFLGPRKDNFLTRQVENESGVCSITVKEQKLSKRVVYEQILCSCLAKQQFGSD